jgi:glycosyltransferase involved in cell wall biosynthesis
VTKVCYVASHARPTDGWGRHTVEVIRGARARGVDPILITSTAEVDPSLAGIEHHPILPPLFARRFETPRGLLFAPRLRRILRACDIVHCTVELYAPLVALACPRGVPYVQTAHGTWAVRPLLSRRQRPLFVPAFRRADRLLPVSRFTRDWMARLIDLPPTEVLSGGVHVADFARPVDASLPAWASEGPVVLSVGGVKARKGFHIALEAVIHASERVPGIHYVVIGGTESSPGYVDGLRALAESHGMANRFHLLGRRASDELTAWYQRADVFTLLSVNQGASFEGLGLVFLEAGAAGTPSIGTLQCGAEEAIDGGVTGLLVPQGEVDAAAGALVRLLSDDALRADMGRAAREHAERMSWDAYCDRLVAIYGELTGEGL